jgi:diguanylate cyclase (GGDEF)-like protein
MTLDSGGPPGKRRRLRLPLRREKPPNSLGECPQCEPEERAQLAQLNRRLRMLSTCNQILIRARSERSLLEDVCRVLVEVGGYRFVWVGYPGGPGALPLPQARAGHDAGFLEFLSRHATSPNAEYLATRVMQTRATDIVHCTSEGSTPVPAYPCAEAQRRGYTSAAAMPLLFEGCCLGVLELYSADPNAYDAAEVALLNELAVDLAYGINVLRARAERQREQQQIAHLTRVMRMQSSINSAVLRIRDRDELLQEVCRVATQVGRYDRAIVSMVSPDRCRALPMFTAERGPGRPTPQNIELPSAAEHDTSLTGRALRTGKIAVCGDLTRSEPPVLMREELYRSGVRSLVALPLIVDGMRVGALTLSSCDKSPLSESELVLLEDIAGSVSFALRSQQQADVAQFLAYYDPLTGLAKRARFCQRLDEMLHQRFGPEERPAVAALDILHLGNINDSFGRHVGDRLLQMVAERLKEHAGGDERLCYVGGGTFVLVEPGLGTSDESVTSLLDATVFGQPFVMEGRNIRISCRSGVARYPVDGEDAATLVQKAEAALKHAKETGERYLHYKLEMRSEIAARLALEHRLREAIDEQQFELYYQPQLSLATGRIETVEALLRWNDPQEGVVLPGHFLPVLESSGMILQVGRWVAQQAVRACERLRRQGLGPVRIAINVSALQMRRRAFTDYLLGLLSEWPRTVNGYGIDLEITESVLLQDLEGTGRLLRELRAAGVRIALDDFGTGYSSLGLLSKLPVDVLKIDRSFVHGLPADPASLTLARSIISLASAFGLLTVAEGVESVEQLEALRLLNCDQFQGYLFCPPVHLRTIEQMLEGGAI